jgi:hypothetical protein
MQLSNYVGFLYLSCMSFYINAACMILLFIKRYHILDVGIYFRAHSNSVDHFAVQNIM